MLLISDNIKKNTSTIFLGSLLFIDTIGQDIKKLPNKKQNNQNLFILHAAYSPGIFCGTNNVINNARKILPIIVKISKLLIFIISQSINRIIPNNFRNHISVKIKPYTIKSILPDYTIYIRSNTYS